MPYYAKRPRARFELRAPPRPPSLTVEMTPPKASFQPLSGPRALRAFGERRALAGGIHRTLSWLIATPPSQVYSRRGGGRGLAPVAATVATPVDPGPRSPSLTSAVTGILLTLHVCVSRRFWQSASAPLAACAARVRHRPPPRGGAAIVVLRSQNGIYICLARVVLLYCLAVSPQRISVIY